MKKLLASVSYSFNNFYDNLNSRGKIVFTIIIILLLMLCFLLFISSMIENIKNKRIIKKLKEEQNDIVKENNIEKKEIFKEDTEGLYNSEKTEIEDIAERVEEALKNDDPITLTSFEELQERTAIISIDELMKKAKELELINDSNDSIGVNYLEKYNLEPAEVSNKIDTVINNDNNNEVKEVKAFKVSQVISPIYGIKNKISDEDE